MKPLLLPFASAAIASCLLSTPAHAVEEEMEMGGNPTAICQGALPNFEGAIRKRPLAVQNEGTTSSFVTCSFLTGYNPEAWGQVNYFGLYLINSSSTAKTVTCTGVAGYDSGGENAYVSKQVSVPANRAAQESVFFTAEDNDGNGYYPMVSMSCSIPPGVGINDTYVVYMVDDY